MRWTRLLLLALASVTASSLRITKRWEDVAERHSWTQPPPGWEYRSPAPQDHVLHLRIGLKEARVDEFIDTLYEVSDPTHQRYGQHLTPEELQELVAPHPSSLALLSQWLEFHNVPTSSIVHTTPSKDFVTLRVPVSQAEALLNAQYGVYHNPATGQTVVRTLAYSLPKVLDEHVNVVAPTTYFGTTHAMRVISFVQPDTPAPASAAGETITTTEGFVVPASCQSVITPACLRALYGTKDYVPQATKVNKLGVTGYLEQFASNSDLQSFFTQFRPDAEGSTFDTTLINGGQNIQSDPGIEASLDLQYTMGMSFPTPNFFFSTGGEPPFIPDSNEATNGNEPYLDFLNFIVAQPNIPQVITTSYGDDEQTVPRDYATTVCNLFAKLGARGTSIIFASGDSGVGAGDCKTNDGTNRVVFNPAFPASCPFVTTVGATTQVNPEVATFFTGGGFSEHFPQPAYQQAAVNKFLKGIGNTFKGLFNAQGRGYPDVAAQGLGFQVVFNGTTVSVGGTSASAPTFASVVSLLNDFRLSHGKPSLGFLNPLLYSVGFKGLTDITQGSNPGCGTPGFNATEGWDPLTGLGTTKLPKVAEARLDLTLACKYLDLIDRRNTKVEPNGARRSSSNSHIPAEPTTIQPKGKDRRSLRKFITTHLGGTATSSSSTSTPAIPEVSNSTSTRPKDPDDTAPNGSGGGKCETHTPPPDVQLDSVTTGVDGLSVGVGASIDLNVTRTRTNGSSTNGTSSINGDPKSTTTSPRMPFFHLFSSSRPTSVSSPRTRPTLIDVDDDEDVARAEDGDSRLGDPLVDLAQRLRTPDPPSTSPTPFPIASSSSSPSPPASKLLRRPQAQSQSQNRASSALLGELSVRELAELRGQARFLQKASPSYTPHSSILQSSSASSSREVEYHSYYGPPDGNMVNPQAAIVHSSLYVPDETPTPFVSNGVVVDRFNSVQVMPGSGEITLAYQPGGGGVGVVGGVDNQVPPWDADDYSATVPPTHSSAHLPPNISLLIPQDDTSSSIVPPSSTSASNSDPLIPPTPIDAPPIYESARRPLTTVRYSLSTLTFNSSVLIPDATVPDTRPVYHISVSMNPLNPLSFITTLRRGGSEDGEYVGDFEMGISTQTIATVMIHGREKAIRKVLTATSKGKVSRWSWEPLQNGSKSLYWFMGVEPPYCQLKAPPHTILARYHPRSTSPEAYRRSPRFPGAVPVAPPLMQLELEPLGWDYFDDIIMSLLIVQRKYLTPRRAGMGVWEMFSQ